MARSAAPRMLKRSISSTLAKTTETLSALAKMISHSDSRAGAWSTFESFEPLGQIVGIENDGGHADRPGQRAAPDLIDAGDPSMAVGEGLALEVEMGRGHNGTRRRRGLFLYALHAARHESRLSLGRKLSQPRRASQGGIWKCRWKETRWLAPRSPLRLEFAG